MQVAEELGIQLRLLHGLAPHSVPPIESLGDLDVKRSLSISSLPSHLVAQADAYIRDHKSSTRVLVHGDLCASHVFVADGTLSAIIDWGDALCADPHYELIQLYRDTFACDERLFNHFLDAYGWPMSTEFPGLALSQALLRQATGCVQHLGMDVFEPVRSKLDLERMRDLSKLARTLFGSWEG